MFTKDWTTSTRFVYEYCILGSFSVYQIMSVSTDCSETSGPDLGLRMLGTNLFLRLLTEKMLKYVQICSACSLQLSTFPRT